MKSQLHVVIGVLAALVCVSASTPTARLETSLTDVVNTTNETALGDVVVVHDGYTPEQHQVSINNNMLQSLELQQYDVVTVPSSFNASFIIDGEVTPPGDSSTISTSSNTEYKLLSNTSRTASISVEQADALTANVTFDSALSSLWWNRTGTPSTVVVLSGEGDEEVLRPIINVTSNDNPDMYNVDVVASHLSTSVSEGEVVEVGEARDTRVRVNDTGNTSVTQDTFSQRATVHVHNHGNVQTEVNVSSTGNNSELISINDRVVLQPGREASLSLFYNIDRETPLGGYNVSVNVSRERQGVVTEWFAFNVTDEQPPSVSNVSVSPGFIYVENVVTADVSDSSSIQTVNVSAVQRRDNDTFTVSNTTRVVNESFNATLAFPNIGTWNVSLCAEDIAGNVNCSSSIVDIGPADVVTPFSPNMSVTTPGKTVHVRLLNISRNVPEALNVTLNNVIYEGDGVVTIHQPDGRETVLDNETPWFVFEERGMHNVSFSGEELGDYTLSFSLDTRDNVTTSADVSLEGSVVEERLPSGFNETFGSAVYNCSVVGDTAGTARYNCTASLPATGSLDDTELWIPPSQANQQVQTLREEVEKKNSTISSQSTSITVLAVLILLLLGVYVFSVAVYPNTRFKVS